LLLGRTALDRLSTELMTKLGVTPVPINDPVDVPAALAALGNGQIGVDIETMPLPQYVAQAKRPLIINRDGTIAINQTPPSDIGLDPQRATIATLQLYAGGLQCFVFRATAITIELRRRILESICIIHNAGFELAFMQHHWGEMPRKFHCTMQAAGLLLGVQRRGLADAVGDYLGLEVPKALQLSDWGAVELSPGQIAYAAADAVLAYRLWSPMRVDLHGKGRVAAYKLQRDFIPAVVDMELRGLGFDRTEHSRQDENWSRELANARHAFISETGKSPPTKPNEIREWLKTVLDDDELQQWPKTPTGELSISKEDLSRLTSRAGAKPVLDILAKEKLLAVFGVKLRDAVNKETGRLHTHYGVAAAKSGRFTSSNPNLQQLPSHRAPEFKQCIVARPGHLLVACDWSAMEMRAAAWASQDVALNSVFAAGLDFHRINAAAIQGIPVEKVTKEQRNAAKPVAFGSIYGMSARGLVAAA
jgi:DNA polymerase I